MQLDSYTILVTTIVTLVLVGCALLYFWYRDRRSSWLLWWSGPFVISGLAVVSYTQPDWGSDFGSIAYGNALRMSALALLWEGARVFNGRTPLLWPLIAMLAVWIGLCLYPPFMDSLPARISAVSVGHTVAVFGAAWELWRGRSERLPSRLPAIVVLCSFGIFMLARIPLADIAPFPVGARPLDPIWMAGFNLWIFGHAFFLGLLLIALTKERLELKQRQFALVDPLTGLMNRRAFMGHVERNAQRRGMAPETTALLVFDLDHFKDVNDHFGHDVGDRVLASFAAIATANLSTGQAIYRLGGEEFCCVLPNTDVHAALRVADQVRKAFAANASAHVAGHTVPATVSIGAAVAEQAGFDLEVLLAAADAALYEAKSRGRNRVVLADPALLRRPSPGLPSEMQQFRASG